MTTLNWLRGVMPMQRSRSRCRTNRFGNPMLEALEDRTLLAIYTWTGLGKDEVWDNALQQIRMSRRQFLAPMPR
jgi:hypothetical protein